MDDKTRELDASALKGLAHPSRLRLLELLEHHGPATATQLAARTGENTGVTSYHLRRLARHGLIEDVPERGRGRERWWRAGHYSFDGDRFRRDPETAQAAEFLLAEMVRQRGAELTYWVEESRTTPRPWLEAGTHSQTALRLTREELADLVRDVSRVLDAYQERAGEGRRGEETPDTARVIVHFDAFPVGLGEQSRPE
ncbi:DNA-binding transcriptional ArsR family regulator [Streptosporangium album]|uniref:DNA-binding transcriptional ArsR family regulator n=1 Tax=Streptosporangium album TaxID=47479 RepID=A0A7W7RQT5_9ACTN|nr:winged helix-turn-helix domain-containing protein [Streptosporangium album]MBB4936486.1 DNA-binding transcriptional ArsR family regulator [Streptosporangium album]